MEKKLKQIETLWVNGEITDNGVREAIKAKNAIEVLESALKYYKTSDLSWKKCLKMVKNNKKL